MYDGIQYGIIPLFIQNRILYMGMEHPTANLIKNIKLPEIIYSKYPISFYKHFLMFYSFKWINFINFADSTI